MREIGIGFRASSSTRFAVSTDAITFERLCVCSHESSQRHFFVSRFVQQTKMKRKRERKERRRRRKVNHSLAYISFY